MQGWNLIAKRFDGTEAFGRTINELVLSFGVAYKPGNLCTSYTVKCKVKNHVSIHYPLQSKMKV